jgi:hypothetical protein
MKDSWWVDMVEGNMENEQNMGANPFTNYSKTDQLIINNLKEVKQIIKKEMDVQLPQEEGYFQGLHMKIMNKIRDEEKLKTDSIQEEYKPSLKDKWNHLMKVKLM